MLSVFITSRGPERRTLCVDEKKGSKMLLSFFPHLTFSKLRDRGSFMQTDRGGKRVWGGGILRGDTRQRDGKVFWERGRRVSRGSAGTGRVDLNWWEWRESGQRASAGDRAATVGGRLYDAVKEHDGAYRLTGRRNRARAQRESKNFPLTVNCCCYYCLHLLN